MPPTCDGERATLPWCSAKMLLETAWVCCVVLELVNELLFTDRRWCQWDIHHEGAEWAGLASQVDYPPVCGRHGTGWVQDVYLCPTLSLISANLISQPMQPE